MTNRPERPSDEALRTLREHVTDYVEHYPGCRRQGCGCDGEKARAALLSALVTLESELTDRTAETPPEELTAAVQRMKLTIWEACSQQSSDKPDPALQALLRDSKVVFAAALKPPASAEPLLALSASFEAEADRVERLSDAEILAEARAAGVDIDAEAKRTRGVLLDAIQKHQAKPIAPSPDAGLEAVKAEVAELRRRLDTVLPEISNNASAALEYCREHSKRLDELELQGLIFRRYVRLYASALELDALARIEREEREKADKP